MTWHLQGFKKKQLELIKAQKGSVIVVILNVSLGHKWDHWCWKSLGGGLQRLKSATRNQSVSLEHKMAQFPKQGFHGARYSKSQDTQEELF